MRTTVSISSTGAVSPAGWGVPTTVNSIFSEEIFQPILLERFVGEEIIRNPVLRVPADSRSVPRFPRLRRASPISKFAAAATLEALGEKRLAAIAAGDLRIGVIFTLLNGCVNYSNRFFGEALADPALASPILFPETVFNAPSSHLSAMIGSTAPNDTLIGDGAGFFTGLDLGIEWLERGDVDGCLVVAAEEIDWLSAEGLGLYSRRFVPSEGAGAVYLDRSAGPAVVLRLPAPVSFSQHSRRDAAALCRDRLAANDDGVSLLLDSRVGIPRFDRPETEAWADWTGPRLSPKTVLGESMGAAAAWQVVAAAEAVKSGKFERAIAVTSGGNQQAAGIVLGRG